MKHNVRFFIKEARQIQFSFLYAVCFSRIKGFKFIRYLQSKCLQTKKIHHSIIETDQSVDIVENA